MNIVYDGIQDEVGTRRRGKAQAAVTAIPGGIIYLLVAGEFIRVGTVIVRIVSESTGKT